MKEIPPPPECAGCGKAIGLWEEIVAENVSTPTSWLRLCDDGIFVGSAWHLGCAPGALEAQF
jgi:hypothetical protein